VGCLIFGLGDSPNSFKTFQIPWLGQVMMILEILAWVLDPSFDATENIFYIFMVIFMFRLPLLVWTMSSLVWFMKLLSCESQATATRQEVVPQDAHSCRPPPLPDPTVTRKMLLLETRSRFYERRLHRKLLGRKQQQDDGGHCWLLARLLYLPCGVMGLLALLLEASASFQMLGLLAVGMMCSSWASALASVCSRSMDAASNFRLENPRDLVASCGVDFDLLDFGLFLSLMSACNFALGFVSESVLTTMAWTVGHTLEESVTMVNILFPALANLLSSVTLNTTNIWLGFSLLLSWYLDPGDSSLVPLDFDGWTSVGAVTLALILCPRVEDLMAFVLRDVPSVIRDTYSAAPGKDDDLESALEDILTSLDEDEYSVDENIADSFTRPYPKPPPTRVTIHKPSLPSRLGSFISHCWSSPCRFRVALVVVLSIILPCPPSPSTNTFAKPTYFADTPPPLFGKWSD
jgi:hypothetical protein